MRWSLKLAELEFTVEHKSGKKRPNVDALIQHVGTVLHDGNMSPEDYFQEKGKDIYCQSLKLWNYSYGHELFLDEMGLIYRRKPEDKHQLLVPQSLVHDVIKANHDPVYAIRVRFIE